MNRYLKICSIAALISVFHLQGCKTESNQLKNPDWLHKAMDHLTKTMVHDIFSPPVSSRIYAYPCIAAYETLVPAYTEYKSLSGQLNGLTPIPKPIHNEVINFELAAIHAFITVGSKLVFSSDEIQIFKNELELEIERLKISKEMIENSIAYGNQVGNHILEWASKDNYKETRTQEGYEIKDIPGTWKPTPPAYMAGIEPNWRTIRTFVLDSASQFSPEPPTKYNMDKESQFYKELMEVYYVGKKLSKEQIEIAKFWDCNPFAVQNKGHFMLATKKITPGGHWIGITTIVTKQSNFDFIKTAHSYALVSVGMADAFISCWDEKWRSNLIRPETVINQFVDEDWKPLLQTPPFPEYTSGHSVVSGAASTILSKLIGDSVAFDDTSELEYGLPARHFISFTSAAEEAAISRLYGGIHYRPAIKNGLIQGRQVGSFVLKNLITHP